MSVNKVILLGNVGKDPEVRHLESGIAVATLSLATTDRAYTLANGTQVPEKTEWHNLVFWRGFADAVDKYVRKGDKLYVEGKIRSRSYDDQAGVKRYITEIVVDNMEMLSPKKTDSSAPTQPTPAESVPAHQSAPIATLAPQNDAKDDLPF